MRKRLSGSLMLLLIFMLLVLPSLSIAQDGGDDGRATDTIYGLVTEENSYVRVGPDFAYSSIGMLPMNASVVVVGRAGDFISRWDGRQWLQIVYGDRLAWIYARLLRTSVPFNSIPPTGRLLPRDRNGRVPEGFDLSSDVCSQWVGSFTQSGDFMSGSTEIVVTYPTLQGATVYTVIVISPTGFRTPFDSESGTAVIELDRLPNQGGTYTWQVAPYWTNSTERYLRQQVCLLQTGGTFEKPETGFNRAGS